MFTANPRSFSIQQCKGFGRDSLEEKQKKKKKEKTNPPSDQTNPHPPAREEKPMLCHLKDLITCNAAFLHQHC